MTPDHAAAHDIAPLQGTSPSPEKMAGLTQAAAEAATGRLRPVIGQQFALQDAAAAHAAIKGRTTVGSRWDR